MKILGWSFTKARNVRIGRPGSRTRRTRTRTGQQQQVRQQVNAAKRCKITIISVQPTIAATQSPTAEPDIQNNINMRCRWYHCCSPSTTPIVKGYPRQRAATSTLTSAYHVIKCSCSACLFDSRQGTYGNKNTARCWLTTPAVTAARTHHHYHY